nr:hypothetical protein CFP56_37179 [Quercus suber]
MEQHQPWLSYRGLQNQGRGRSRSGIAANSGRRLTVKSVCFGHYVQLSHAASSRIRACSPDEEETFSCLAPPQLNCSDGRFFTCVIVSEGSLTYLTLKQRQSSLFGDRKLPELDHPAAPMHQILSRHRAHFLVRDCASMILRRRLWVSYELIDLISHDSPSTCSNPSQRIPQSAQATAIAAPKIFFNMSESCIAYVRNVSCMSLKMASYVVHGIRRA